MQFNRWISGLLSTLNWRHFCVGALQAYLFEGPDYEQRLHIWHESLVAPGIRGAGDMHNHRFSFTSKVLCGKIFDKRYLVEPCETGDADVYGVVHAREQKEQTGLYNGNVWNLHRAAVTEKSPSRWDALAFSGEEYEVSRGEFHVSQFQGITVTLVTKFDIDPNMRAEIVAPHGKQLVHAFDESRKPDIPAVLSEAQSALLGTSRAENCGPVRLDWR